jgi:hypothetical protein
LAGKVWEARSVDTSGMPDEPRPRLEVRLDGHLLLVVEGWRHELKRNDGFVAARDGLLELAVRFPASTTEGGR